MFGAADFVDQIFPFFVAAIIIVFFVSHFWQIMLVLWIIGLIVAATCLIVNIKRRRKLENECRSEGQPGESCTDRL